MKPIKFKGHNLVLAEDQPEYLPLPVCNERNPEGALVSCWKLSFWERMKLLFTGKVFIRQLTFGGPLQPLAPMTDWQDQPCLNCGAPIGDHKHTEGYLCAVSKN